MLACDNFKPKARRTREEQLRKNSCKAVSSAVFSCVCVNFGEAKIIKHDRHLSHDTAELTTSRDFLLSCFLSCALGLSNSPTKST